VLCYVESGNLCRAIQVGPLEYDLQLDHDINTHGHTQWFFFRVHNSQPGVRYKFNIINFEKKSSAFNKGMRPVIHSQKYAAECGIGWHRATLAEDISYYPNHRKRLTKGQLKSVIAANNAFFGSSSPFVTSPTSTIASTPLLRPSPEPLHHTNASGPPMSPALSPTPMNLTSDCNVPVGTKRSRPTPLLTSSPPHTMNPPSFSLNSSSNPSSSSSSSGVGASIPSPSSNLSSSATPLWTSGKPFPSTISPTASTPSSSSLPPPPVMFTSSNAAVVSATTNMSPLTMENKSITIDDTKRVATDSSTTTASDTFKAQFYHTLTFTISFVHEDDTIHIAHHYPYTYSQLRHSLNKLQLRGAPLIRQPLCYSISGNLCELLTITDMSPPPSHQASPVPLNSSTSSSSSSPPLTTLSSPTNGHTNNAFAISVTSPDGTSSMPPPSISPSSMAGGPSMSGFAHMAASPRLGPMLAPSLPPAPWALTPSINADDSSPLATVSPACCFSSFLSLPVMNVGQRAVVIITSRVHPGKYTVFLTQAVSN
jgi:hypothetical protein